MKAPIDPHTGLRFDHSDTAIDPPTDSEQVVVNLHPVGPYERRSFDVNKAKPSLNGSSDKERESREHIPMNVMEGLNLSGLLNRRASLPNIVSWLSGQNGEMSEGGEREVERRRVRVSVSGRGQVHAEPEDVKEEVPVKPPPEPQHTEMHLIQRFYQTCRNNHWATPQDLFEDLTDILSNLAESHTLIDRSSALSSLAGHLCTLPHCNQRRLLSLLHNTIISQASLIFPGYVDIRISGRAEAIKVVTEDCFGKLEVVENGVVYVPDDSGLEVESAVWAGMRGRGVMRRVPRHADTGTVDTLRLEELLRSDHGMGLRPVLVILRAGSNDILPFFKDVQAADSFTLCPDVWMGVCGGSALTFMKYDSLHDPVMESSSGVTRDGGVYTLRVRAYLGRLLPTHEGTASVPHEPNTYASLLSLYYVLLSGTLEEMMETMSETRAMCEAAIRQSGVWSVYAPPDDARQSVFTMLIRFEDEGHTSEVASVLLSDEEGDRCTKHVYTRLSPATLDVFSVSLVCVSRIYLRLSFTGLHDGPSQEVHNAIEELIIVAKSIANARRLRTDFEEVVRSFPELMCIPNVSENMNEEEGEEDTWIGIGYTPMYIDLSATTTNPLLTQNLDQLNLAILLHLSDQAKSDPHQLYSSTIASSSSNALPPCLQGGTRLCIRIGCAPSLATASDLRAVLHHIVGVGSHLEKSPEFVNRMSEIIKKGIQDAERLLMSESIEESPGLIRMLPIVGSVLSWWRPLENAYQNEMGMGQQSQDGAGSPMTGTMVASGGGAGGRPRVPFAKTFSISSGFAAVPIEGESGHRRVSVSLSRGNSASASGQPMTTSTPPPIAEAEDDNDDQAPREKETDSLSKEEEEVDPTKDASDDRSEVLTLTRPRTPESVEDGDMSK
ncbi:hypothetical protein HDU85_005221 [Gaertneriomyces sp. JEL0708]|nr:hypothetical protein HDU85_005221 [Gaertneriomyces sp. JEL0708]